MNRFESMENLIKSILNCTVCMDHLPMGPNPVLSVSKSAKIVIIGQAPGLKVHNSGIPWDDLSGRRLRDWMNLDKDQFYDSKNIAIIPMGFCYPGKGKSGDLPPRKECAPLWHQQLFDTLETVELILLVGKYAQDYYLPKVKKKKLTETVSNFEQYLPEFFPLPHPSPRNIAWFKRNAWFEKQVIPRLQLRVQEVL